MRIGAGALYERNATAAEPLTAPNGYRAASQVQVSQLENAQRDTT